MSTPSAEEKDRLEEGLGPFLDQADPAALREAVQDLHPSDIADLVEELDERDRLLAKLLREARDTDVWAFVSPRDVAEALPRVERWLGRRRDFWRFLIDGWREDGLLG